MLEALKRDGRGPTLMRGFAISENDAAILSFVSHRPCSIRSHMAGALSLSQTSIKWHIRKLAKAELIACRKFKGHETFYPVGMLTDEEARVFALLASPEMRSALREAISKPGSGQDELSGRLGVTRQSVSRAMREMAEAGLVMAVRDGRSVRYYPTEFLTNSGEAYADRRKALLDGTMLRLTALGLRPRVIKSDPEEVHILIGGKGMQTAVRFGLNPYVTLFWD
jgi:DNA-binding transcriptional ArsR family regulator